MGTERVDGLPDELESWVEARAAAGDLTREDVVRRLLAAHRELDESDGRHDRIDPAGDGESAVEADGATGSETEAIERELDEIADRVAALEADLDEKITDVRERVIQVKRETDAKAPAEHDHPEIERRLSAGFENYEEILEYLAETSDEHGSKLDRLGSAVLALRSRLSALERAADRREAAADLRREANRHGVATAACESCGETVRLGLLDEPRCPHCDSSFDGLDPKRRFFDTNRLTVGDRPALESAETSGDTASPGVDDSEPSHDRRPGGGSAVGNGDPFGTETRSASDADRTHDSSAGSSGGNGNDSRGGDPGSEADATDGDSAPDRDIRFDEEVSQK